MVPIKVKVWEIMLSWLISGVSRLFFSSVPDLLMENHSGANNHSFLFRNIKTVGVSFFCFKKKNHFIFNNTTVCIIMVIRCVQA